jgi:hypothetical protein
MVKVRTPGYLQAPSEQCTTVTAQSQYPKYCPGWLLMLVSLDAVWFSRKGPDSRTGGVALYSNLFQMSNWIKSKAKLCNLYLPISRNPFAAPP